MQRAARVLDGHCDEDAAERRGAHAEQSARDRVVHAQARQEATPAVPPRGAARDAASDLPGNLITEPPIEIAQHLCLCSDVHTASRLLMLNRCAPNTADA